MKRLASSFTKSLLQVNGTTGAIELTYGLVEGCLETEKLPKPLYQTSTRSTLQRLSDLFGVSI